MGSTRATGIQRVAAALLTMMAVAATATMTMMAAAVVAMMTIRAM